MEEWIADSSGVLAAIDAGEPDHATVTAMLTSAGPRLWVTDFALAEVDYLILKRLGANAERKFIEQVLAGTFERLSVDQQDMQRAAEISLQYAEHELGLTDSCQMALAERRNFNTVLTLDRRHFSMFRTKRGEALTLVP